LPIKASKMSGITFSDEIASRLEALYQTADVVAQRTATLAKLGLTPGDSVIDVGSGPGFLCESMADAVGPAGSVLGLDVSSDLIERSTRRNHRPWLSFKVGDATAIGEPNASFDVLTCIQVAEYIADVDKAFAEAFRDLKPGGRALFVATDWDGVIWHSDNPARMAAVMRSWDAHCADPRLPRTMARRLRSAGFTLDDVSVFSIVNLAWHDDAYSKGIAGFIREFVTKRGEVAPEEATEWAEELSQLSEQGRYFFSTGRFLFLASK
jgi:ubiquinone/menaquinone biosynthesis C-methylase UbiE